MRLARTLSLVCPAVACLVYAQLPENFEVALVRPSDAKSTFQSTVTSSQFIANRHTLQMLIQTSYPDLPPWRISGGPAWLTKDSWDVVAKLPPGASVDQEHLYRETEQLIRNLLIQEFKLKTHIVQREQPVYNLVPAKGGPKMKASEGAASFRFTIGGYEARHQTMQEFASSLYCPGCTRQLADRPVLDKTGLSGYFDFALTVSADQGPSVYTALEEQLGLKLQPAKAMLDFLVVDQAERPTEH